MAAIIVFFRIFFRKFWHLVKLNILFFVFNLPAVVVMPFISRFFWKAFNKNGLSLGDSPDALLFYIAMGAMMVCIPVVTVGPAQSGFTFVLRNFAREEHAFLWEDLKEHSLKNAGQSVFICLTDLAVVLVTAMDISFYLKIGGGNVLFTALAFLLLFLFLLYLMMHIYIYPMLVTFRLSVIHVYKNALIFSLIRFFPNLGILALCFIIAVLPLLFFPVAGILLFPLITMSTVGLVINFYVYPTLEKFMVDKLSV